MTDTPPEREGEGPWAKLRRRKVVQWGVVYAAGAWGFLQGLEYATDTFHWPDQIQQLTTLALLVGLPIVLVTAWYHGDRGQQRVSAAELVIITLLFLLGGGIFWRYDRASEAPAPDTASLAQSAGAAGMPAGVPDKSIAVLPFVNMSGDADNEYFSDGISEEILNVLARVPELNVAARTSSFQFKGEKRDISEIAAQLKVRMVLEGSVRKQSDRVRVTAQLIDAQSGFHLWSETYDRELQDIFAIQDEIARAIGAELKVRVLDKGEGSSAVSGTTNVAAHDLYLRGLSLWRVREEDELFAAIDAFERAIAADPGFAQAWGGLAITYAVLPAYSNRLTPGETQTSSLDAAQRALALDPTQPEPYLAMGQVAGASGRRQTASALMRRAIALRPSSATAHQWLGTTLVEMGELDAGIASLERAAALDPRSLIVASNLSSMLQIAGRDKEAIAACMPTLEYAPDAILCTSLIGLSYLIMGDRERARPFYDRWAAAWGGGTERQVAELFEVLEGRGDRASFARRLVAFPERSWRDPASGNLFSDLDVPILLLMLGEPALALDYVDRGSREGAWIDLSWGVLMPSLDPIRCDPRFQAAVERIHVVDHRAARLCAGKHAAGAG
jgi:TolB-like protein/cytochrome c-type biogenesis protein CcmH/NrfG